MEIENNNCKMQKRENNFAFVDRQNLNSGVRTTMEESDIVEFKISLAEIDQVLETISAFSNSKGGKIYIGIADNGEVKGLSIGKGTLESLANSIKQNTDPVVFPDIEVSEIDSKKIIVISVTEYPIKPVWVKEKVFVRVGKTNQRASAEKIREMINKHSPYQWDKELFSGLNIKEIDSKAVKSFISISNAERNSGIDGNTNVRSCLEKLNLIHTDKLTNAAILLFGKEPQRYFPRSIIKCGRFKGNDAINFIDIKEVEGTIIQQVPQVLQFIRRHINVAAKITGEPQREDVWEIPEEALREAVINAVCHRNYEDTGNVQVRIFDNRLEIWNPGNLPSSLTIDALKKDHRSLPRNELIARCFYLIRYVEQWGTGTNRIISLCKDAGLKEPEFEVKNDNFIVRFLLPNQNLDMEIYAPKLNETQRKIIKFLRDNGPSRTSEIQASIGLTRHAIIKNLKLMDSLLNWSGSTQNDPSGRYSLKEK